MSRVMRRACLGLLLSCVVAGQALATTDVALANARGAVTPISFTLQDSRLPASQAAQLRIPLEAILARLRQSGALSSMQGFSIDQSIRLSSQPDALANAPATGLAFLLVRRIDPARSRVDKASGALLGIGEGPGIEVQVNDQRALFGYSVGMDAQGDYYQLAVKPRRLQGFPVLEIGNKDVVVINKPGRKPFRHISRQRYLEGLLATDREQLAALEAQLAGTRDAESRAQIQPYLRQWRDAAAHKQALLAGMSAAERAAPTCQASQSTRQLFGACDAPGAVYYVTFNPDYFQSGLARSSVQLLTISVVGKQFLNDHTLGKRVRQAVGQLDLQALQQSLD